MDVYVRLCRVEGYEDADPALVIEDARIQWPEYSDATEEIAELKKERAHLEKAWGLEKRGLLDRINELVERAAAAAEQKIKAVREVLKWGHRAAYDLREDIRAQLEEE